MRKRTLFIHVGPPKTGTSAIQSVLRDHDNEYLLYPKIGLWHDGSHHNLVFSFFHDESRPEARLEKAELIFDHIAEIARRVSLDIVISSEALSNRDLSEFILDLSSCLEIEQDCIEILVVCREHFERAASLYNQALKDPIFREARLPSEYLVQNGDGFCYLPMLRRLSQPGYKVTIINYHPEHDFVERFLAHIGFPKESVPPMRRANVSLSLKALISTLAANKIARSVDHRNYLFDRLRMMKGFYAPSRFLFDFRSTNSAIKYFNEDSAYLMSEYGVALPRRDLESQKNEFFITNKDLEEISAVCSALGSDGEFILSLAEAEFLMRR